MNSSAKPRPRSSACRSSRTAGIRDAQVANSIPLDANTTRTAHACRRTARRHRRTEVRVASLQQARRFRSPGAGAGSRDGLHPPGPQRPVRQPVLPGHDELRARDLRGRLARDHGPGPRARHQLLRHRQRLWLEEGRGGHRADRRPLVRAGRWPAGEDRHRDQALRLDERLAQRHVPVRPQHPARLRGVAATAADRLPRPLPDAPRRPATLRGTRSGRRSTPCSPQGKVLYVGSSNHAGWHIAKGMEAARRRHSTGLVSEQSIYNLLVRDVELEVLPACQDYGLGVIPWSPLQGGLLGGIIRKTEQGKRRLEGPGEGHAEGEPQGHQGLRGPVRRARRVTRPTWGSPGCSRSRR